MILYFHESKITEPGVYRGSAALRSMQNRHSSMLDLLVRESIQNSSDAARKKDDKVFWVNYTTNNFRCEEFSKFFNEGFASKLNSRFSGEQAFLEIRDKQTEGLTGETQLSKRKNNEISNYLRLTADMGDGQEQKGAGGNWGYGKSIYYRLGKGIVIYYSRIKATIGFESRMVITLIEDEKQSDALLRTEEDNSAGRAWWGIESEDGKLSPITDEKIIEDILKIFGLEPYKEAETGTSVIIPFIDIEQLLDDAKGSLEIDEGLKNGCEFLSDITKYLEFSVQKWYAPILNNTRLKELDKKILNVRINGMSIRYEKMNPIFKMVQDLYVMAYSKNGGNKDFDQGYSIICKKVEHQRYSTVYDLGYGAFCKIKRDVLYQGATLPAPETYFNFQEGNFHGVLSLYTRDLGMVINYDEDWVQRDVDIDPGEILLMMFVPLTKEEQPYISKEKRIELGEYLRQVEAADHMRWSDISNANIKCVKFIKSEFKAVIRNQFGTNNLEEHIDSDHSVFAKVLGESLFPSVSDKPKKPGGGGGAGGGDTVQDKKFKFEYSKPIISNNGVTVSFKMELKEKSVIMISTKVYSIGGIAINFEKWGKDIGVEYPLAITDFFISNEDFTWAKKDNGILVSGEKGSATGSFKITSRKKGYAFVIDCYESKGE